ncbi:MAG: DUF3368 domain-containing protein [Acidobacteriota bacterium]
MIALLDNTVLSNFAAIGRPDLIRAVLGEYAATVEEAFAELQAGIRLGRLPSDDWSWLTVLSMTDAERVRYQELRQRFNAGESACLTMASMRRHALLTDDRDARTRTAVLKIPVSGTLGLLARLVQDGGLSVSEANDLLARMITAGYRSPIRDVGLILAGPNPAGSTR